MQIFNAAREDDYFDPIELRRFWLNNEDAAHRLLIPKQKAAKVQTQNRNADLVQTALGASRSAGSSTTEAVSA